MSAGYSSSSAVFQSPVDPTPTLPPAATDTPVPPATDTPVPAATDTPDSRAPPTRLPLRRPIRPIPRRRLHRSCRPSTPLPTYVPPPPPPPPSIRSSPIGRVQPGQTLYCIGRYYQVSPWAIASVNYIPWPYYIYPGQVLAIPNAPWYNIPPGPVCYPGVPNVTPTPPPVTPTHRRRNADAAAPLRRRPGTASLPLLSLRAVGTDAVGIAWYYGTTIQAIMYANPSITNPNLIYAGSTLCIP